jgi:hypothetical protein
MAQPLWKTIWWFLKNLKMELLCDSAIQFLVLYPKELKVGCQIDTYTSMFTVVSLTLIVETIQESTDKPIKKM